MNNIKNKKIVKEDVGINIKIVVEFKLNIFYLVVFLSFYNQFLLSLN